LFHSLQLVIPSVATGSQLLDWFHCYELSTLSCKQWEQDCDVPPEHTALGSARKSAGTQGTSTSGVCKKTRGHKGKLLRKCKYL